LKVITQKEEGENNNYQKGLIFFPENTEEFSFCGCGEKQENRHTDPIPENIEVGDTGKEKE
jgi:hypothetical protein